MFVDSFARVPAKQTVFKSKLRTKKRKRDDVGDDDSNGVDEDEEDEEDEEDDINNVNNVNDDGSLGCVELLELVNNIKPLSDESRQKLPITNSLVENCIDTARHESGRSIGDRRALTSLQIVVQNFHVLNSCVSSRLLNTFFLSFFSQASLLHAQSQSNNTIAMINSLYLYGKGVPLSVISQLASTLQLDCVSESTMRRLLASLSEVTQARLEYIADGKKIVFIFFKKKFFL